jgi:integrase
VVIDLWPSQRDTSEIGTPSARAVLAKVCRLCGIRHNRHTFAVNNLRTWFAGGENVSALLPVLQAYMGHSSISDTAYYLRLTAESYPHIAALVEREHGGIVPPLTRETGHGD